MEIGDVYQLEITKLDHKGRGIGRIHEKIVFVTGALPLEIVEVKITVNKKNYAEAEVLKIVKTSPYRVEALCPYFGKCGGCDLMHLQIDEQHKFKEQKVKEIMEHFASIDSSCIQKILFSEESFFYRNKATFKVQEEIGYFEKKSYHIVPIDTCQIIQKEMNDILICLKKCDFLSGVSEFVLRITKQREIMLIIKVKKSLDKDKVKSQLQKNIHTAVVYQNKKYEILWGRGYIVDNIGKFQFKISPDSFFQINPVATKLLYDKVLAYADLKGQETLMDLYCGTGTLGIYLHEKASQVIGVEINKNAVSDAKENAKMNHGKHIDFKCQDVSDITKIKHSDVIIVDPPRAGLDKKALSFLLEMNAYKVIYVSCDPVTLARDLKMLKARYDVKEITPVDMFPHTNHVECVSLLCLK